MNITVKSLALGVSLSVALSTAAQAVVAVAPSVSSQFFFDEETGDFISPAVVNEGPAVTITEEVREEEGRRFVEYVVENNTVDWDIIAFGVTNPGTTTSAYVSPVIACGEEEVSCWSAETIARGDIRSFDAEEDELTALLFGEDNTLHLYAFNEVINNDMIITDAPSDMQEIEFGTGREEAFPVFEASAILAGTVMGGFFFNDGVPASNMLGFAVNASTGSAAIFSNINLSGVTAVPVPAGALLLTTGLFGLGVMRKKRT